MSGRKILARGMSFAATAVGLFILARLSAASVPATGQSTALLRMSWSARPERIETCRVLSQEELEKLLEHMRQRVQCEGKSASYLLTVSIDGVKTREQVVRGAGLRNDRAMYLLEDMPVTPGRHDVQIDFVRRERDDREQTEHEEDEDHVDADDSPARPDTGLFAGRADRERVERARLARAAVAPRISLDTTLVFDAGRAVVITLRPGSDRFQLLTR